MSLEIDLINYLTNNAGITTLVAGRVFADGLPQTAVRPAIVVTTISGVRGQWLSGPSGSVESRVQIDCQANDRPASKAVFAAVNAALKLIQNAAPTVMVSTEVGSVTIGDERDSNYLPEDGSGARVYETSADAMFLYGE